MSRFKRRSIIALLAAAVVAGPALPAWAGYTYTGNLSSSAPPANASIGAYESSNVRAWTETNGQAVHLTSALAVDVPATSGYNSIDANGNFVAPPGGSVPAGARIVSLMWHLDPVGTTFTTATGRGTYDNRIAGLILNGSRLNTTNSTFNLSGTAYWSSTARGLELGSSASDDRLSVGNSSVGFTWHSTDGIDEVRVLLDAPKAPDAPTGATATAGDGSAAVTWTIPGPLTPWHGGSAVTGMRLVSDDPAVPAVALSGTQSSVTVPGLQNGKAYRFALTATNTIGTSALSAYSAAVTPQPTPTAPSAPQNVSAAAGDAQATVSWTAPASDGYRPISGYTVTARDGTTNSSSSTTVGATATSYLYTGLTNGHAYTFTVAATNSVGTGPAATSNAVYPKAGPSVPTAPQTVSAEGGIRSATVRWSPPASDGGKPITGYRVTTVSTGATQDLTADTFSVTVTGLTGGQSYTFKVQAINALGAGQEAVTSPVAVREPASTSVSISGTAAVTYGGTGTISARLRRVGDGTALGGRQLSLFSRRAGTTAYVRGTTVVTDGTGLARWSVRPSYNTVYVARFLGAPEFVASSSPYRTMLVRTAVSLSQSFTLSSRRLVLTGAVRPAHAGQRVTLQRYSSGAWRNVAYATLSSISNYRFAITLPAHGSFRHRVVKTADSDHTLGISAVRTLTY